MTFSYGIFSDKLFLCTDEVRDGACDLEEACLG
jgi:hypothetical protein